MQQGALETIPWNFGEQAAIDNFHERANAVSTTSEQREFMLTQASRVPHSLSKDTVSPILFGALNGNMRKNGMMLLRQSGKQLELIIKVDPIKGRPGPRQGVNIIVRNDSGLVHEQYFALPEDSNEIKIALDGNADLDLYQIEWEFDHAECSRPSTCISAKLLDAKLQPATPQPH